MIGLSGMSRITLIIGQRLAEQSKMIRAGRIIVRNVDGTFNREILLTAAEYLALGSVDGGTRWTTHGVTAGEVAAGQAIAAGLSLEPGGVELPASGAAVVFLRRRGVSGQTKDTYLRLEPGEWSGSATTFTVAQSVIDTVPARQRPVSLVNGILVA